MSVEITKLPSGLTVVTDTMPHLETAALGVWAGVGGRDEKPNEHGISHLLEHMAFKGTARRSSREIVEEIEAVGALGRWLRWDAASLVDTIDRYALAARAAELGDRLQAGFRQRLEETPGVVHIRGRGLMIGIELDRPCADLVKQALAARVLINVTAERVVRLLPPLTITDDEIGEAVARLDRAAGRLG